MERRADSRPASRLSAFLAGMSFVLMWLIILELADQSYFHGNGEMTPLMWFYLFVAVGVSYSFCLRWKPLEKLHWNLPVHWTYWPLAIALGMAAGCVYPYAARYYDLPPRPFTTSLAFRSMALTGGPALEELIFRVAILGGFLMIFRKMGFTGTWANWSANFATALPFALWHSTDNALIFFDAFLCALVLGWLRLRSGSVAVAALAHGVVNLTVMILTPLWAR